MNVVSVILFLFSTFCVCYSTEFTSASESKEIFTFDIRYTDSLQPVDAYEHVHLLTSLGGLANRDGVSFYQFYIPADEYWLTYLKNDSWLEGYKFTPLNTLDEVLDTFQAVFKGLVVYDPNVYSTAMLASTISGVDNLLPVCYRTEQGTLYDKLVNQMKLPIVVNLLGMFNGSVTGSTKNDAYRWLIDEYIKTGKVNPLQVGYYLDYFWTKVSAKPYNMHTVSNQDFVIAQKDDEAPNDDPNQPKGTDLETVNLLFHALYELSGGDKMIQVNGFTPWRFKYITSNHGGVESEWETVRILSSFNVFLDADACCIGSMTNSAFYSLYPIPDRFVQNPSPSRASLQQKGYLDEHGEVAKFMFISFYVGDYDSSAWFYSQLPDRWSDGGRGNVALGWALNPTLSIRFPVFFPLLYSELSPLDLITTGDSGAGYVNPTQYFEPRYSGLPDGTEVWRKHSEKYMSRFNLKYTGFIIQGRAGKMTNEAEKMYNGFSYEGACLQQGYQPEGKDLVHLQGNTPYFFEVDISHDPHTAADSIAKMRQSGTTQFNVYRGILQYSKWYAQIQDALPQDIKIVTPLELAYLARVQLGGNNDNRVTFVSDNIPKSAKRAPLSIAVDVRNEGWNDLDGEMHVKVEVGGKEEEAELSCPVIKSTEVGQCTGDLDLTKVKSGEYELRYQVFYKGEDFSNYGNLWWVTEINVLG